MISVKMFETLLQVIKTMLLLINVKDVNNHKSKA
jgi:hypothetical protein